jgi:hypothetical protein
LVHRLKHLDEIRRPPISPRETPPAVPPARAALGHNANQLRRACPCRQIVKERACRVRAATEGGHASGDPGVLGGMLGDRCGAGTLHTRFTRHTKYLVPNGGRHAKIFSMGQMMMTRVADPCPVKIRTGSRSPNRIPVLPRTGLRPRSAQSSRSPKRACRSIPAANDGAAHVSAKESERDERAPDTENIRSIPS